MKYLNNLLSSEIFYCKKDNPDFSIIDSGLYILHPRFNLKKISGEEYLKVGMTTRKDKGLRGRLSEHFSSNYNSSVLARHLYHDQELGKQLGFDFKDKLQRQCFLKENCYFQVLPLEQFNWCANDKERKKRIKILRNIEKLEIEETLRKKIRFIGKINKKTVSG
jgi:hypothetical protein